MRRSFTALTIATAGLWLAPAAQAVVTIGPTAQTVPETGTLSFTLTRPFALGTTGDASVVVRLGGAGDTARCPADVAVTPAMGACDVTVSVPAGTVVGPGTATVRASIVADALDEADESITATIVSVTADTVGSPASAAATITDDDAAPPISVAPVSGGEGTGPGATTLGVPVRLSAPSGRAVTVGYDLAPGTATAEDVALAPGTLTIPAGQTTGAIPALVVADVIDEDDESFTVTLREPVNATFATTTAKTAAATITDDDAARLSVADVVAPEGTNATTPFSFAVTLSTPSSRAVTVPYATDDIGAIAPGDYTAARGILTFAPGQTAQSVRIDVVGDAGVEGDEAFGLALTEPVGAALADATAQGTILDDDRPAAVVVTPAGTGSTGMGTGAQGAPGADRSPPKGKLARFVLRRGVLRSSLSCPATEVRCRATITVFTIPARRGKVRRLRRELKLAARSIMVAGGRRGVVSMRVSAKHLKLLKQAKRTRVRGYAVIRDAAGNVGTAQAPGVLRP